jgi:hypothetical protein
MEWGRRLVGETALDPRGSNSPRWHHAAVDTPPYGFPKSQRTELRPKITGCEENHNQRCGWTRNHDQITVLVLGPHIGPKHCVSDHGHAFEEI